jgi:hypothetical protein
MPVSLDDVREVATSLPRAYEAQVRDATKYRVGQIVFAAVSPDETKLGFGFPKDQRDGLIASDPDKFLLPRASDLRYQWCAARLEALDVDELRELIIDAWAMCVPKKVREAYFVEQRLD